MTDLAIGITKGMAFPHEKGLNSLALTYLHRAYNKIDDGRMIANLTPENLIVPEIASLLHGLAAG